MSYTHSHMDKRKHSSRGKTLARGASCSHGQHEEMASAGDCRPSASQWQPEIYEDYGSSSMQNTPNVQQAERPMEKKYGHTEKIEPWSCSGALASGASYSHAHSQEWTSGDCRFDEYWDSREYLRPSASQWQPGIYEDYGSSSMQNTPNVQQAERPMEKKYGAVANLWQTEDDRGKSEISNQNMPNAHQEDKSMEVKGEAEPSASQWQPEIYEDYGSSSMQNTPNVQQAERPMEKKSRPSGNHRQQDAYGDSHVELSNLNTPNAEHAERHMEMQSTTLDPCQQPVTRKPSLHGRGQRSSTEELPGMVTSKVSPQKVTPQQNVKECEECEKMKEKNKDLEERIQVLLNKAMKMHQNSENMNDCWRLSAVLQRYDKLRLHEWEKFRTSQSPSLSYSTGSKMIQEMFHACELDLQRRIKKVWEVLEIPALNDTAFNNKQELVQQIKDILKYGYSQKTLKFYSDVLLHYEQTNDALRRFVVECCQVYCGLRLQDIPIKAEWGLETRSEKYLEHVDKKGLEHCGKKIALLWPILKRGEQVIRKGIIYDEK